MLRRVIESLESERIALRVLQENEAAIRLYEKAGFETVDVRGGRQLMELR